MRSIVEEKETMKVNKNPRSLKSGLEISPVIKIVTLTISSVHIVHCTV